MRILEFNSTTSKLSAYIFNIHSSSLAYSSSGSCVRGGGDGGRGGQA